ncbi:MAG: hypothetical protein JO295_01935 [Verrucomicrobia bacterium]|nr:hypothetical protein [Verrucomicrobiota bacterium]
MVVYALGQDWSDRSEVRPTGAVVKKVIKGNFWAAFVWIVELARTDANPIDLLSDSVGSCLATDAANANDCVER